MLNDMNFSFFNEECEFNYENNTNPDEISLLLVANNLEQLNDIKFESKTDIKKSKHNMYLNIEQDGKKMFMTIYHSIKDNDENPNIVNSDLLVFYPGILWQYNYAQSYDVVYSDNCLCFDSKIDINSYEVYRELFVKIEDLPKEIQLFYKKKRLEQLSSREETKEKVKQLIHKFVNHLYDDSF